MRGRGGKEGGARERGKRGEEGAGRVERGGGESGIGGWGGGGILLAVVCLFLSIVGLGIF